MMYHLDLRIPAAVSTPGEAGAPEDEIEITPEMTSAGMRALAHSDPRFMRTSSIVEEIFTAMALASPNRKYLVRCSDSTLEDRKIA
jgi:hypothetical protein